MADDDNSALPPAAILCEQLFVHIEGLDKIKQRDSLKSLRINIEVGIIGADAVLEEMNSDRMNRVFELARASHSLEVRKQAEALIEISLQKKNEAKGINDFKLGLSFQKASESFKKLRGNVEDQIVALKILNKMAISTAPEDEAAFMGLILQPDNNALVRQAAVSPLSHIAEAAKGVLESYRAIWHKTVPQNWPPKPSKPF